MLKSRFTAGAYLCAKCWGKEAPADRVCASCPAGVDTVLAWCKSKRIEGAPWLCKACYSIEVRTPRFFPLLSRERATRDVLGHGSSLAHRAPFAFPVLRSATKS